MLFKVLCLTILVLLNELNLLILLYRQRRRRHERVVRITNYERTVWSYTSTQFQQHFRISKPSFIFLRGKIIRLLSRQALIGRQTISIDKQILSALWLLATPESFRSVGDRFNMGKSSLFVSL